MGDIAGVPEPSLGAPRHEEIARLESDESLDESESPMTDNGELYDLISSLVRSSESGHSALISHIQGTDRRLSETEDDMALLVSATAINPVLRGNAAQEQQDGSTNYSGVCTLA
jgi:hypothetical protein